MDLDAYLKINSSEIDNQDLTGKTALAWAASRKDPRPVRTLLKHGASTRVADYRFKTPLHYCAGSGDPEAVQLILEAIKERNELQPGSGKSVIEAGDDKNRTPLNYASRMNLYPHTQLLVDYGADLEATESKTKRTILLNAVYWNSHKVLPLLLARGARTDIRDSRNETLLHHIARFADLQTLQIMAEHDLGYIDVSAVNVLGLTALQIFDSTDARCSPEAGNDRGLAAELFSTILRNARRGNMVGKDRVALARIQEVEVSEEEADDRTTEEAKAQKVATVVVTSLRLDNDDDNSDDDADEVFYDALMEIVSLP